ncbi:MAG: NAD(P)/FAD-dependent oxidoreductase [Burkholderiaceae bacterium]|nr:NAD(P)/FAD-dependent oxidoreductase [Burkholderiaceae bacterium]MCD8516590.1 NAD(P)/FAD-dependent oxidoreductase [Burkholderiaceae bacterium]MCD8537304.1 NAD(P)/FAD-dependent oxidoreductase [Burkholderiaceae bacterium]MCD8565186.1 NAD(P)/FAD-dependent oxidoreductase [Burkholderiaceae bacterium]
MSKDVQCIVIGAGVVGLAVARELSINGLEVMITDRAEGIGTGTSSRNSEVIHAGIYYPAGSLKARLCVQGKHMLYEYCQSRGVNHRQLGKLIVATDESEHQILNDIKQKAAANGVTDLQWLNASQARSLEPALSCTAALLSPSTGIIDSHGLMLAYQGDAENAGAQCVFHCPFESARVLPGGGFEVSFGGVEPVTLTCDILINAAGLQAPAVAQKIDGLDQGAVPKAYLCKGSYFNLQGKAPFDHLIYPVPQKAGLGVHLTLDLGGQAKFGPDTQWVEHEDYDIDPARGEGFYEAVRRYWPDLKDGALQPGYTGIRPKISAPNEPAADFCISGPSNHGVKGLVNLFGIESPGLTASMAIGLEVRRRLNDSEAGYP